MSNGPVQLAHLVHPVNNPYGNPLPNCVPNLVLTAATISAMAFRLTPVARQLATMVVRRNVDFHTGPNGNPVLGSTGQVLHRQNYMQPDANGHLVDSGGNVQTHYIEAAMVQCVGLTTVHGTCAGSHVAGHCTGCKALRGPFRTCVYVGPVPNAAQNLFFQGACPNCYYQKHGCNCSCRDLNGGSGGSQNSKGRHAPKGDSGTNRQGAVSTLQI